jgi:hypothetical protein
MSKMISFLAFIVLTILWVGFYIAMLANPGLLNAIWYTYRSYPFLIQVLAGILLLPLTLGLWVWESGWSFWTKIILVVGMGIATIYLFFPRSPK